MIQKFNALQNVSDHSAQASSLTININVTENNLLVARVSCGKALDNIPFKLKISDSLNNVWLEAGEYSYNPNNLTVKMAIFYSIITKGGNLTVTLSPSSSAYNTLSVDEYSVSGKYIAIDSISKNVGSGSIVLLSDLLSTDNNLICGLVDIASNAVRSTTPGNGFVKRWEAFGYGLERISTQDGIVTDSNNLPSNLSPQWTLDAPALWAALAVSFRVSEVPWMAPVPESPIIAEILTTGRVLRFLSKKRSLWRSSTSDPILKIKKANGTVTSINLTNQTGYSTAPYVTYPLPVTIEQSDILSYSASEDWVNFDGDVILESIDEPVINLTGKDMSPLPVPKMPVGMNVIGPNPNYPVTLPANLVKNARNLGSDGSITKYDDNFVPVEMKSRASYGLQWKITNTGIDNLGTGGREGIYTATWKDCSPLGNVSAFLGNSYLSPDNSIVSLNGNKLVLERTDKYIKYRQAYNVTVGPKSVDCSLWLTFYFDSVDIKDVQVAGPWEDPDSTCFTSKYVRDILKGGYAVRLMQAGEANNSTAAKYSNYRKTDDVACCFSHSYSAKLIKIESIPKNISVIQDKTIYPITDKYTLFPMPTDSKSSYVGIYCTTSEPHGFESLQSVDFSNIINKDFSGDDGSGSVTNCGLQVNGVKDGVNISVWMRFGGQTSVDIWVVDPTHFIAYPGYIVDTIGVADPVKAQNFDPEKSILSIVAPSDSSVSMKDYIRIGSENKCGVWINFCGATTSEAMKLLAKELVDEYLALGDDAPPFVVGEKDNELWNWGFKAFRRDEMLSYIVGNNVTPGAVQECYTYQSHKLLTIVKDAFVAAGIGDKFLRGIWWQNATGGEANLAFAAKNNLQFEIGGDSCYIWCPAPDGSWDNYDYKQWFDLWESFLAHDKHFNEPSLSLANIKKYMPNMIFAAYEGGRDQVTPRRKDGTFDIAAIRNWYYDSRSERLVMLILDTIQRRGYDFFNWYTLSHSLGVKEGTAWSLSMADDQKPGPGLNNVKSLEKGSKVCQDTTNENPGLLGYRKWVEAINHINITDDITNVVLKYEKVKLFIGDKEVSNFSIKIEG